MGGERVMSKPVHTHYYHTMPPRQVVGTLLDCTDRNSHRVEDSELWADYPYFPEFGPASHTGLSAALESRLVSAYMEHRSTDTRWVIADVTDDDEYIYRVRITNRTAYSLDEPGPTWHTEEWGIHSDEKWHRIVKNPHPPYEHWPAFCPNCGY
jgi:hypothetical protein